MPCIVASATFVAPVGSVGSVGSVGAATTQVCTPSGARSPALVRWRCCAAPPSPPQQPPAQAPPPSPPQSATPQATREFQAYSMNARLREETEAPFRKFRQFLYAGSGMSAAVGAFIAATRVIAALSGVRGPQPLSEAASNVIVDIAGAGFFYFLWSREQKAGNQRLERMRRGARIAALTVREPVGGRMIRVSEFRKRARVVIVSAPKPKLVASMLEAQKVKDELAACKVVVVPFEIRTSQADDATKQDESSPSNVPDAEMPRGTWLATPADETQWSKWLTSERELSASSSVTDDNVFVVILRMNGKVGSRSLGAPNWAMLTEEVRLAPIDDAPPTPKGSASRK